MVWSLKKPWLTSNHPLMSLSSPLSPLLDNRLSILLSFRPGTNSMIMAMDQVSLIIMHDVCSSGGKWWNSAEFMWRILKGVIICEVKTLLILWVGWLGDIGVARTGYQGRSGIPWYPVVVVGIQGGGSRAKAHFSLSRFWDYPILLTLTSATGPAEFN